MRVKEQLEMDLACSETNRWKQIRSPLRTIDDYCCRLSIREGRNSGEG